MRYKPNVRYIRRIGTNDTFPWTPGLATRPDMEEYDPFSNWVKPNPEAEECSADPFTKLVSGMDREHIREGLKGCKHKLQKILWCILNTWEQSPGIMKDFKPSYRDISVQMGPTFTKDELKFALNIFKENPNREYLMSDAVEDFIPAEIDKD